MSDNDDDTIRLTSTSLVHAPGYVDYLRRAHKTDQVWAFETLATVQPLMPMWAAYKLFKGDYDTEGDTVILKRDKTGHKKVQPIGGQE